MQILQLKMLTETPFLPLEDPFGEPLEELSSSFEKKLKRANNDSHMK